MKSALRCCVAAFAFLVFGTVSIAAPPIAIDDSLIVATGSAVTADFRLNDADPDGAALVVTGTTLPTNGSLVDNGNGTLTYVPNPGFAGSDFFTYDVTDGSTTVSAGVSVSVNAVFDPELARDQILLGVSALVNPVQPGHMVAYGPTAYVISNYPGENLGDPMVAAATLGQGRVIALPDHQWLNMDSYGGDPSMATFYQNGIAWLADSSDLTISVVTYDNPAIANWLTSRGYTNVVNATSGTLSSTLGGADVFVAGWLGSNISASILQTITDYVSGGGGLFLADYGIGYDWWWGQTTENIPGNKLLRPSGLAFTKTGYHGGGAQTIQRAVGQMSFEDVLSLVADWSSASEAEKTQAAALLTKIDSALADTDTLQAQLDATALASAGTLHPTPTTPVSDSFEKAILTWESNYLLSLPVTQTVAHPTALPVGATAPRVSATRTFTVPDGHATIRIPTGLYAAPGEIVTIGLPAGYHTLGLRARISHLRTDLSDSSFYHMPFQQVYFDLSAPNVAIASPYGGLISIEAESGENGINNTTFSFDNVVEAPYYVHGVTTDAEWNGGIRDRETPFGVLVTEKTIHVIESEAHLRALSDPERVMQIWEDMIRNIEEFYSYTTYRPLRIHHDYQPVGGFSTFPQSYDVGRVMLDYSELVNYGHALTHHEYGHIIDPSEMIIRNFSEASPNFGGIYASRFYGPFTYRPKGAKERINRYEASQSADLWATAPHTRHHEKITPFICLADAFGWDKLIDVIAALKLTNPASDQDKLDNWLTLYSNEVGYDLSPFFAQWQLTPSASALAAVSSLPLWNMVETVEERLIVHRNANLTFPSPAGNDFSYDGSLTLVGTTLPAHGTLTLLGQGDYQYVPDPAFTGSDSFEYTVVNGTGNSFTRTVPITVLAVEDSPKLWVGTTTAATGSWTQVSLPHTYSSPVVIAQPMLAPGTPAVVTRVRNVTDVSFEVTLQRPGSMGSVTGVTVHYFVAEEGVYDEATHGLKMEAIKRLSTVTDTSGNLVGEEFLPQWNTTNHYALPAFFGQVMSYNDPNWSTWWSNATSQIIVAGKHVGSDTNTNRADETLGSITLESGTVQFGQNYLRFGDSSSEFSETFGSGGNTLSFAGEPQVTAAIVQATGLSGGENAYWSALTDTNNFAGNEVSMALRNDGGLSVPTDRAGYLIASRISQDCNSNGLPDESDIFLGISQDNDLNGIPDECELLFRRSDANVDGSVDIADPVAILGFLFAGDATSCALALDANDDGGVDVADPIYALAYLFQVGSAPPPPPFLACGTDPTPDGTLTCDRFGLCP